MKSKKPIRILLEIALLILALPMVASAQVYNRYYESDRSDRNDLRTALARLDDSSARLENDLNYGRGRSVLGGLFYLRERGVDNDTIVEVQNFRQAVRDLRRSVRGGFDLSNSRDEAMAVLDRGIWLDRYL